MERIGFGLFGSPIGLNYVSNGLFKTLQIEGETYLNLPNGVELEKGERIAKISRQVFSSSNIEVIKIYIYEYAISFDERGGGFIGSAYVFAGNPTQTLLHHAVKHLHPKVYSLLDGNRKFKSSEFNLTERDLINPNTTGLIDSQSRKISTPTDKKDYLVLADGSLFNHLMSVVQGFMYNPNFRNVDHIYVSEHPNLLKRIANNNEKSILGLSHLLNFQNHFDFLNKKLQEKNQERVQLEKNIQEKEKKATTELENKIGDLKQELDRKQKLLNQTGDQLTQLTNDFNNKQDDFNRLELNFRKGRQQVNNLKQEISTLKDELNSFKAKTFSEFLNDKRFASHKKDYEKDVKLKSNQIIDELEQDKKKLKENYSKVKRKILVTGGVLIFLFLLSGYLLGDSYHLISNRQIQEAYRNNIVEITKEENCKLKDKISKKIQSITFSDSLNISEEIAKEVKKKVKNEINNIKPDEIDPENQELEIETNKYLLISVWVLLFLLVSSFLIGGYFLLKNDKNNSESEPPINNNRDNNRKTWKTLLRRMLKSAKTQKKKRSKTRRIRNVVDKKDKTGSKLNIRK